MELAHTLLHPTIDGDPIGGVMSLAVGDFDNDGGAFLEILSCVDQGKTATIWKILAIHSTIRTEGTATVTFL